MSEGKICKAWFDISMRCGEVFGKPLPHRVLTLGNPDRGWGVRLNASREKIDGLEVYDAHVTWGGFPAGIIGPSGGIIAAGEAANEQTFLEWIGTAEAAA